MRVKFSSVLNNLQGEPIKDGDKVMTLLKISQNALLAQGEKNEDGVTKVKSYQLAVKLNDDLELTAEDIALIKKKIGEHYAPIVVGQAWDILDIKDAK